MLNNPVAPFYEFIITLWGALPVAFSRFVSVVFVCFIIIAILEFFWRVK